MNDQPIRKAALSTDIVHDDAAASQPVAHTATQHAPSARCHNCGAPAPGQFCAQCGQGTTLHVPSAREFLHEFVGHYVALEGKLWGTLMRLLFRPGALTNEYIAGRRVRYVEPLRVYLTFSILFFFLIKLPGLPGITTHDHDGPPGSVAAQVAQSKREAKLAAKAEARAAHVGQPASAEAALDDADDADEADLAKSTAAAGLAKSTAAASLAKPAAASAAPEKKSGPPGTPEEVATRDQNFLGVFDRHPQLQQRVKNVLKMPQEEQTKLATEAFFHYAPYAMFCLLPVFALYLKVLYLGSGRLYGEHFLFALHSNAFAFLMFALIAAVPWGFVQFVLVLWLLGYLPWAMRRVYRRSKLSTTLRWMVLISVHFLTIVCVLFSVVAAALLV